MPLNRRRTLAGRTTTKRTLLLQPHMNPYLPFLHKPNPLWHLEFPVTLSWPTANHTPVPLSPHLRIQAQEGAAKGATISFQTPVSVVGQKPRKLKRTTTTRTAIGNRHLLSNTRILSIRAVFVVLYEWEIHCRLPESSIMLNIYIKQ